MSDITQKQSSRLIAACIAFITKAGAALELKIQEGTTAVIRHGRLFHDVDKAKEWVTTIRSVMPGYAVNQLEAYIQKYSPIKFEYSADKMNVVGVKEAKDEMGNLIKAYATDETLDAAPFRLEKAVKKQNQKEIAPFSFKLYQERLASLETQLTQAGKADGRGLLGKDGRILHENDKDYKAVYDSLYNAIHAHRLMAANISTLVGAGTPAAATAEVSKQKAVRIQKKAKAVKVSPAGSTAVPVAA